MGKFNLDSKPKRHRFDQQHLNDLRVFLYLFLADLAISVLLFTLGITTGYLTKYTWNLIYQFMFFVLLFNLIIVLILSTIRFVVYLDERKRS